MNYKAKTREIYKIRNQIAETIGKIEKPQPLWCMDGSYIFNRKEFDMFKLKISLSYSPLNKITITIP